MKTMKKLIGLAVMLIVFAACSEKNAKVDSPDNTSSSVVPVNVSAIYADNVAPAMKSDFDTPNPVDPSKATWTIHWNVGDEIALFNQAGEGNGVIYQVKSIDGSGRASFELKEGEDVSKFGESTTFYACKGGLNTVSTPSYLYAEDVIRTGLSSFKSIQPGTINNDFHIAIAKATIDNGNLSFTFHNAVSYIRIVVPEGLTGAKRIYFAGKSNSYHGSGYFRVGFADSGEIDPASYVGNGGQNVPVYYGNGAATSAPTSSDDFVPGVYYVPIEPGYMVRKIIVYSSLSGTDAANAIVSVTKDISFPDPGVIYDLGTIPAAAD
ncbi:MAG: hypothetical protein IJS07_00045 [Bacteroidales bacterium]|nr:hypothetical protein [Bacteroidales bacterium]